MARDVEANLVAHDRSSAGVRSLAANMTAADKAAKAVQGDLDKATESTKKLGSAADVHKQHIKSLNREIELGRNELKSLATAFAQTQDAAERLDISKAMRKQETEIRRLTKNRNILQGIVDDLDDAGKKGGAKLLANLSASFSEIPALAGPILAGVGVAAAPLIGAAISGAIIGGAGVGGVVGGILIASKDARVQAAAEDMASRVGSRLQNAAVPFIDETIAGIDEIEAALGRVRFERIFANAARFVQPLASSVSSVIEDLGGAFDDLIANAGPAVDTIAAGITTIGDSLSSGLENLADNGESAAAALGTVLGIVNSAVQSTLALVNVLTELYEINQAIGGDMALQLLLKLTGAEIDHNADASKRAADGATEMANSFQAAAPKAAELNAAVAPVGPNLQDIAAASRDVHTAFGDLFASETAVATAIANASAKIKENGRNLTLNSAKGRENREALTQVAGALQANYDKYVKVNGVGPQSAALADDLRAKFIKLARAAGMSADGAKNLADQILDIPDSHDTKLRVHNEQALDAAREVRRAINNVQSKTVTLNIAARVTGSSASRSALNAALNKQSLRLDAASTWSASGGGTSRTGGPTPVELENTVNVSLDGEPFYAYTAMALDARDRRRRFRDKVGTR